MLFFFRQTPAYELGISDWRSDVCASDRASPKFTPPLRDTPQTIQVIGKELFNEQVATTLTEVLRNSPGVGTFYAGENGNTTSGDAIRMRGFDTSNSIFVDGIRDLGSVSRDIFNTEAVERSEEHTSELQSLMRISYAVSCLKKKQYK